MSTPPKRNQGHERDETQPASNRSIPNKVAPKLHVTITATLLLETLQVLVGVACQEDVFHVEDPFLISTADVSRAHFYADAVRDVCVRFPKTKQPGVCVCGKLRQTMYGSLDAAQRWTEHYAQVLEAGGFSEAWHLRVNFSTKTWRRTFWCTVMISSLWVDRKRKHALSLLRGAYELSKVVTLGPELSQSRTVSFLGRTLTLRQWKIEYEPDQQHVSRALKALGLTNAQGVATPGTDDVGGPKASQISEVRRMVKWRDPPEGIKEEDDLLTGEKLKLFQMQFYGSPSTYRWDDEEGVTHEICQGEGGEQGDALMPALFSLGLHGASWAHSRKQVHQGRTHLCGPHSRP